MNAFVSWYENTILSLIDKLTFLSFTQFVIIYVFIVWIAMIMWVTVDITQRSSSILLQIMCIALVSVLGPLGLMLYLILRPRHFVHKKYLQEIEQNLSILWNIVEDKKEWIKLCPKCSEVVAHDAKTCKNCKTHLGLKCYKCNRTIIDTWKVCPFCSTRVSKSIKKAA